MTLEQASATFSFSDRPARKAADLPTTDFAQDFDWDFAGDLPNVAVFGWTRSQRTNLVATATRADWQAGPKALRYDLVQFPEQAPATELGGRRARRAAARGGRVRLRRCIVFVDSAGFPPCPTYCPAPSSCVAIQGQCVVCPFDPLCPNTTASRAPTVGSTSQAG